MWKFIIKTIEEESIKEGIREGKIQTLFKILTKFIGGPSSDLKEKIYNTSDTNIDNIQNIKSYGDIDKYIK